MKRHRTPLLQVSKRDGKDVAAGKKSPKKRKKIIKKNEKNVENVKIETLQLPTEKRQYRREADHAKLANEVDLM